MEINDARLVDASVQAVDIIRELHTVVLDDIRCTTHRCGCVVAMLSHLIAGTGDDEAGCGRNIEGVLAVAARTHYIDVAVAIEDGRNAGSKDAITEAQQLIYGDASHLQTGEQGCDLLLWELTLGDADDNLLGFLARKFLVVQHSV